MFSISGCELATRYSTLDGEGDTLALPRREVPGSVRCRGARRTAPAACSGTVRYHHHARPRGRAASGVIELITKTQSCRRAVSAMLLRMLLAAAIWSVGPQTAFAEGAEEAESRPSWSLGAGAHGAGIGPSDSIYPTFGVETRARFGWARWGFIGIAEQNFWMRTINNHVDGALNIGLGVSRIYADRWMEWTLGGGSSILMTNDDIDSARKVGVFLEIRPAKIRIPLRETLRLNVDPLSFSLVMPVLTGIPLVRFQYRSAVNVEFDL